jgi:hypothetical protein
MTQALSPEEALAEVRGYTGLELLPGEIQSLHEILTVPRKDTAIVTHLRKAGHPLANLQHLPEGENWWDRSTKTCWWRTIPTSRNSLVPTKVR